MKVYRSCTTWSASFVSFCRLFVGSSSARALHPERACQQHDPESVTGRPAALTRRTNTRTVRHERVITVTENGLRQAARFGDNVFRCLLELNLQIRTKGLPPQQSLFLHTNKAQKSGHTSHVPCQNFTQEKKEKHRLELVTGY